MSRDWKPLPPWQSCLKTTIAVFFFSCPLPSVHSPLIPNRAVRESVSVVSVCVSVVRESVCVRVRVCVRACSSICVCMAIPRGNDPRWEGAGSSRILEVLIPKVNPSPGRLIPDLGGGIFLAPLDSAHVVASGQFLPLWPQFTHPLNENMLRIKMTYNGYIQSQRKTMTKNVQTTTQLYSSHTLAK